MSTIVNDKYKIIFIHTPRTGGTTISEVLDDHLNIKSKGGHKNIIALQKKGYYSFTFVRNPYDRLVSTYHIFNKRSYLKKHINKYKNFEQFCLSLTNNDLIKQTHVKPQHTWFCDENDKILVDFIGRFENYNEDVNKILKRLKLEKEINIPIKNSTKRDKDYKVYYKNNKQIEAVTNFYKKDLELFNYKFE